MSDNKRQLSSEEDKEERKKLKYENDQKRKISSSDSDTEKKKIKIKHIKRKKNKNYRRQSSTLLESATSFTSFDTVVSEITQSSKNSTDSSQDNNVSPILSGNIRKKKNKKTQMRQSVYSLNRLDF